MASQQYAQYDFHASGSPASPVHAPNTYSTQPLPPSPDSKETNPQHISNDSIQPLRKRPTATSAKHGHFRAALGLHKQAPIVDEHDMADHSENLWPRIRMVLREPFSEFWGTFIMVMFGDGSVAQVLLSAGQKTAPGANGRLESSL